MDTPEVSSWKPVRRLRTYEQVLEQIEEQILRGTLGPGDRLPPERQLAEALGVSRAAVREALRILEAMGVVRAGTGSGPSSGSVVVGAGGARGLSMLLRLNVALTSYSQREVMEVRVQLERWSAHEAAARAESGAFDRLEGLLEQMSAGVPHDEYNALDAAFHVGLAEICGNALLSTLMQAIRAAVQREMVVVFSELEHPEAVIKQLTTEHRAILAAVRAGNADQAAHLVQQHIEDFYFGHTSRRGGAGGPDTRGSLSG